MLTTSYRSGALFVFAAILQLCVAPPVKPAMPPEDATEIEESNLEYGRYLKEVVEQLEGDSEFKRRIANASQEDIRSGKIADYLEFVHPDIRSKLHEVKRLEIDRIKTLAKMSFDNQHINSVDEQKFGQEDLRKLVIKATRDLEKLDIKRKEEFKEHEMQEKYSEEQRKNKLTPEELAKEKLKEEEEKLKHAQHPELNHPMTEDHQKEVWEKVDKLPVQDFDPKTFFHLHDLDGNKFLDESEIKALLQKELDKVYGSKDESEKHQTLEGREDNDTAERFEEMERMREEVFQEMDKDQNRLISIDEFMENIKRSEYKKDPGWKTIDEQPPVFSEQEYLEYQKQQNLAQSGPPSMPPMAPDQALPSH